MQITTAEKDEVLTAQRKEHETVVLEKETLVSHLAETKQKLELAHEAIKQKVYFLYLLNTALCVALFYEIAN
jgi:hypothetical protein